MKLENSHTVKYEGYYWKAKDVGAIKKEAKQTTTTTGSPSGDIKTRNSNNL